MPHSLGSGLVATNWDDRLAFDVALLREDGGETEAEVFERHGITASMLAGLDRNPLFVKAVELYRKEIVEKNLTFRLKARVQADELLRQSYLMIHDEEVPASVRADLIKSTVKWAGLDGVSDADKAVPTGGVSININLGDGVEKV